jgi:hypothetical protein
MIARSVAALAVLLAATGCVVAPPYGGPVYGEVAPVYGEAPVYSTAPTYISPGIGFIWQRHPRYGYGWHHPHRGWHRGWHHGGGHRGWR